jgi:hypothetical protein
MGVMRMKRKGGGRHSEFVCTARRVETSKSGSRAHNLLKSIIPQSS